MDLKFAACIAICPEDASDQEKRIQKFLDVEQVF
jgi:ferredoxin